jgi:hypothetical protein
MSRAYGPTTPPVGGTVITAPAFRTFLMNGVLFAASAVSGSGDDGPPLNMGAGNADGSGTGGGFQLSGGTGENGAGGEFVLQGGISSFGDGGDCTILAGLGGSSGGTVAMGGVINLVSGYGGGTAGIGGAINIQPSGGAGGSGNLEVNSDPTIPPVPLHWYAGQPLNNRTIFTATRAYKITAIMARIDAVNGSALTLAPYKAASGTAYSGGTALTTNSANLNTGANSTQTLTLAAGARLAAGDSVGVLATGTPASGAGALTIQLTPI